MSQRVSWTTAGETHAQRSSRCVPVCYLGLLRGRLTLSARLCPSVLPWATAGRLTLSAGLCPGVYPELLRGAARAKGTGRCAVYYRRATAADASSG
jgi:hypothetical protein